MNIVKPHVSLNVSNVDASVAMHDDPQKTSAACCAPASLSGDAPLQLGKKSACC
jgi:hypothetical protein